ncbi:hypothetical protein Ccrd_018925, partial [Cynara cardunculus var. scolymus]
MSVIAAPMVVVAVLQYLMQLVAVVMVGHIDEIALSSVAIATSLTNVTGFSLLSGLVGGLETLCGQAFGAKQYNKIGVYTCSAIISLLLVCIPVSISWIFLDKFLILIGQDPLISIQARKFSIYLIPALFAGAILKPLVRSLQTQSLTRPLLVSSALALCINVPLCWAFVFKFKMGSVGAAIAFSVSNWLYLMLIVFHIKFSISCENTRVTLSMNAIVGIKEFFRFGIPSAPQMVVARSACLDLRFVTKSKARNLGPFYMVYFPRLAVRVVMLVIITEATIVSTAVFGCRHFLGKAYSNDKPVVSYVASMAPGWQHIGAYVNLGAFYLFGIPAAVGLGFPLHLKAKGLWIGIVIGSVIQSTSLSLITGLTDWRKQVRFQ